MESAVTTWKSFADRATILTGDCRAALATLPDQSVHCCVTSPPYYALRDYQVDGQIGLEKTPHEYVESLVSVFAEVWRVLRDDGTLWLNLGDSYAGAGPSGASYQSATTKRRTLGSGIDGLFRVSKSLESRGLGYRDKKPIAPPGFKSKDLIGIPWSVAFALRDAGWYLRSDIIWHAPNKMPESVTDRPSKAHEYIFLLAKQARYFYDAEAVAERSLQPPGHARLTGQQKIRLETMQRHGEGNSSTLGSNCGPSTRNKRSVWSVPTQPNREQHFASYPPKLIEPCILAGTSAHGCCQQCGAPYRRVVEKVRTATRPAVHTKTTGDSLVDGNRDPERHVTQTKTVGWQATCECNGGEPVPCTVLDPFTGSGTTGLVALQHGRRFIGCELNPAYVEIATRRINKLANQRQLF